MNHPRPTTTATGEAAAREGTPAAPPPAEAGDAQRFKPTGVPRILRAFAASGLGFVGAFRSEAAFRQELALAVFVIPLGLWLGRTGVERALLLAPMLLILVIELVNSAIEAG